MQISVSIRDAENKGRRLIAGRQSPIRLTPLDEDETVRPSQGAHPSGSGPFPYGGPRTPFCTVPKPVLSSLRVTSSIIPLVRKFRLASEERLHE